MASGSNFARNIGYVTESSFGTTPGSPTMKALRFTGGFANLSKGMNVSEEIRADGQIFDARHSTHTVTGDLAFELAYGDFDDWLEMALGGTWATNVLKAGRTKRYFTLEERFTDISEYRRTLGVAVNTMSLSITPEAMVTGSFGVLGKSQSFASTSLGTPTAPAGNPPFDGFAGMAEGGSSTALLTSLELNLNRNLEPVYTVRNDPTAMEYSMGRNDLTGTATFLFQSEVQAEKFVNETESSITATLEGAAGGDLEISLPRVKYSGAEIQVGTGTILVVSMPFQALFDTAAESNIVITRTPAA